MDAPFYNETQHCLQQNPPKDHPADAVDSA